MTARLRAPEEGEPDHDLLLLGAAAGALVCGALWLGAGLPLPRCAIHAWTGCPCPMCGATRCMLELAHGQVLRALSWNPLAGAGLVAGGIYNGYTLLALTLGLPRARVTMNRVEGAWMRGILGLMLGLNWWYVIHHGV